MDSKTGVEDNLRELLGTVAIEWAYVDAFAGEFLAYMLKADPGSLYVVTQNVSASTISGWLRTLAPIKFTNENTQKRLQDLFNRIDECRSDRNALIHGLWKGGPEPTTATVQTIGWHRSAVAKHELVTKTDLTELIESIREVISEMEFLAEKLGFAHFQK